METKLKIVLHEIFSENYLRLHVQSDSKACGSVDFIGEKINFNISCRRNFFKGMEVIKNIEWEYTGEKLIFIFRNGKNLAFSCNPEMFATISRYIKDFQLEAIKILKIDRSSVQVEIDGYILKILGEAMLPEQPPKLSEYVLYRNSLKWLSDETHPTMKEEELFVFMEKEFLKRNLFLIIE